LMICLTTTWPSVFPAGTVLPSSRLLVYFGNTVTTLKGVGKHSKNERLKYHVTGKNNGIGSPRVINIYNEFLSQDLH
jgi:hypothetical protein